MPKNTTNENTSNKRKKRNPVLSEILRDYVRVDEFRVAYRSGYKELGPPQNEKESRIAESLVFNLREYEVESERYEYARNKEPTSRKDIQKIVCGDREPTEQDEKLIEMGMANNRAAEDGSDLLDALFDLDRSIDEANAYGLIRGTENLLRELKQCQNARKALRRDNEILSARLAQLERLNKIVTPLDKTKKRDDFGLTPH